MTARKGTREAVDAAIAEMYVVVSKHHKHGRAALAVLRRELVEAYAALPPSKGEHAPPGATLAERVTALAGDVTRWRMLAERHRAQMISQQDETSRHEIAATAAGMRPHVPGSMRTECPGCQPVPVRDRVVLPRGGVPASAEIPVGLVEALQDGLATPGSGTTTLDIPEQALRSGVVAVLRAYLAGGESGA